MGGTGDVGWTKSILLKALFLPLELREARYSTARQDRKVTGQPCTFRAI